MDQSHRRLLLERVDIRCRRLLTLCILSVLLAAWGCQNDGATTATTDNAETAETPVQRGEHLVGLYWGWRSHRAKMKALVLEVERTGWRSSGWRRLMRAGDIPSANTFDARTRFTRSGVIGRFTRSVSLAPGWGNCL